MLIEVYSDSKIWAPLEKIKEPESPGASAFNLDQALRSYKYYCFDFLTIQDLK